MCMCTIVYAICVCTPVPNKLVLSDLLTHACIPGATDDCHHTDRTSKYTMILYSCSGRAPLQGSSAMTNVTADLYQPGWSIPEITILVYCVYRLIFSVAVWNEPVCQPGFVGNTQTYALLYSSLSILCSILIQKSTSSSTDLAPPDALMLVGDVANLQPLAPSPAVHALPPVSSVDLHEQFFYRLFKKSLP